MRKIAYFSLYPHLKDKIAETEILPFPWEQQTIDLIEKQDTEKIKQEIEEMKAFWEKIDIARAAKNKC